MALLRAVTTHWLLVQFARGMVALALLNCPPPPPPPRPPTHPTRPHSLAAGKDEPEMVERIFSMFGVPTEKDWPDVSKLPL